MRTTIRGSVPILSCDEARTLETRLFAKDEAKEWTAMQRAGRAIADAVVRDFEEVGGISASGRILVLAGKGHNGGDALIAAQALLEKFPHARAEVVFVFGERALRPLAARAWRDFSHACGGRVEKRSRSTAASVTDGPPPSAAERHASYELCLDGIFGFQFRAPAEPGVVALLEETNATPIRLRAAVDLPSGGIFRADFTYATGSVKSPLLNTPEAGRVRFLDLGFFTHESPNASLPDRALTTDVLAPLAVLRDPRSDKRTYGHVFVLGGSRSYPGAVLMTVLAALRSGAGLVTAFVPESLVSAFAARAPEAMWVGWPETPTGGLALEGEHLLRTRIERATALVIGPGLARETETLALAKSVVAGATGPLVIDADALQPDIVTAGKGPRILTPHAGEFARIAAGEEINAVARRLGATVVLKGSATRISAGEEIYHSFHGGPVLARGGSGDVLAGLIGGLLAQSPKDPLLAAARGVVWQGCAADCLARAHGQTAVQTTQLLDYLAPALRGI